MRAPLIETRNATRIIAGDVPATLVADVDVSVSAGEFIAIIGPSGSGKSSLLYLLGLLDRPTSGEVYLEGVATSALDDDSRADMRLATLGFVFQFHFLLPEFSARENIILPMRALRRLSEKAQVARADMLLEQLGLKDHAHKRPDQMSGGQRQRVAIARALANDPKVVLADEPTGNLDTHSGERVLEILNDLVSSGQRAVVMVTHDLALAARADRQIRIVDGRIAI
ncbi:MAG TPA: ABC transporter ATP-binding protein [Beijerinckiaceae bacterium]|mgnify:CR=1 FL=1|nr:ABC transporter ATP-binding protein [Rhodoblastus sp.]MCB9999009.1 ABC transporter ATP-binding protein [Methylobacteriaceae bacterium]MCC2102098.1 ABC transporter ATP-binding protein [Hyphomicrobiales bacterium]HRY02332.1 ABC transporter ATP-binding protein [Beijerinckiaceae bacterium]